MKSALVIARMISKIKSRMRCSLSGHHLVDDISFSISIQLSP